MAINRQNPPLNLIFHSDRGSQYCSNDFRKLLTVNHIQQSMSRKGNPYDNAVAENFFSCLKCEFTFLQDFKTRSEAKTAIFRYIEGYYNLVRPEFAHFAFLSGFDYVMTIQNFLDFRREKDYVRLEFFHPL